MANTDKSVSIGSEDDQRINGRTSLMLRNAKVICQSGEYICIVRDVSEMGAGLGFFHAVPPEPRIILELANGATYPIERVWQGKSKAGYRFAAPIDLDDFIDEESNFSHRPIRVRVGIKAKIIDGRHCREVVTHDLSCDGARFECEDTLEEPINLKVILAGFGPRTARVRWTNDIVYGISFGEELSIEQLAMAAFNNQPYFDQTGHRRGPSLSASRVA